MPMWYSMVSYWNNLKRQLQGGRIILYQIEDTSQQNKLIYYIVQNINGISSSVVVVVGQVLHGAVSTYQPLSVLRPVV